MNRRQQPRPAVAFLLAAMVMSCGGDPTQPSDPPGPPEPPVPASSVVVTPGASFLDLADTSRFTAAVLSADGEVLSEPVTWRSLSPNAAVDGTGLVTGLRPGEALIEAEAPSGVTGSAGVRITPVSAIQPDTGRWGQVVTVLGEDLPVDATVHFTGGPGGRVPAHIRQASAEAIEVWVPVGAGDGSLRLMTADDSVVTSRGFRLTAPRDVYAGLSEPALIPVPYHNPSLLTTSGEPHAFRFSLPEPTPFSLHLLDPGATFPLSTVRAWLFRVDPSPSTLLSFLMTRDQQGDAAVLPEVAFARETLAAGEYVLLVAALDLHNPDNPDAERPFGIRLAPEASFTRTPDDHEPNDFPAETPLVALPFDEQELSIENPYAMDHYTFELTSESTVTIASSSVEPGLLMFLMPEGPVDILAAWDAEAVVAEAKGELGNQEIEADLPAGRYALLVWDWAGRARSYDLAITTGQAGAVFDRAVAGVPAGVRMGAPAFPAPDVRRAVLGAGVSHRRWR